MFTLLSIITIVILHCAVILTAVVICSIQLVYIGFGFSLNNVLSLLPPPYKTDGARTRRAMKRTPESGEDESKEGSKGIIG